MKRLGRRIVLVLLALVAMAVFGTAALAAPVVYSLPIHGEIEPGLAAFVARGIQLAERNQGLVLLEINTFGGRVDAATEIKDLILKAKVPIIAYVSERAWSAGALIALSAPKVAMAPGSSIGAAEPRPMEEKTVSALKAEFEATAERWGRNRQLAAAMVDADVVVEGLVEKGKILTLSAQDALDWNMADILVASTGELLGELGYGSYEVIQLTPHWAEQIARFLTNSTASSLLLSLGFLGLIFEITSQVGAFRGRRAWHPVSILWRSLCYRIGGPGSHSPLCFGYCAPGLGSYYHPRLRTGRYCGSWVGYDQHCSGLWRCSYCSVQLVHCHYGERYCRCFSLNRLRQSRLWQRLVLSHRESPDVGYRAPADFNHLVGQRGMTISPLRPAGTIMLDGHRYDVVSEGGFVPSNSVVEVVLAEGTRLVVREVREE